MSNDMPLTTAGQDTIAALATPPGTSGIAVLRCSGEKAVELAAEVFEGPALTDVDSHTVHYGRILDEDACIIDEVLVTVFRTPRSYTGEDSIEISCHGGMVIAQRVLNRLLHAGARHAEPGEFTRRAFLNGKMDLAQAEAVADLIHAQSEEARQASVSQLEGSLSRYVSDIRKQLLNAASMLELSLDFVEEDVAFLSADELNTLITEALEQMTAALASFRSGRLIRDGVRVALLGPPNVGKSSLLNALLGTQRAIVMDVPGTTRDYIEEQMLLHGEYFRFVDTAGLRETADRIEQKGIAISHSILEQADIICAVTDAREGTAAMTEFEAKLRQEDASAVVLPVFNKADLVTTEEAEVLNRSGIALSALHGTGMEALITRLSDRARSLRSTSEKGTILVTNVRHADCLKRGVLALNEARSAGTEGKTEEFLAYEVRNAIDALGEIIGEVTTNDILNGIFARFCIGK